MSRWCGWKRREGIFVEEPRLKVIRTAREAVGVGNADDVEGDGWMDLGERKSAAETELSITGAAPFRACSGAVPVLG